MTTRNLSVCLLAMLALASSAAAQKSEFVYTFAGTEAGRNRYERKPDGTFTSISELTIGPQKISSSLSGRIVNGLLTEYEMTQSMAGQEVKLSASGATVKVSAQGKTVERPYKPAKLLFASFHPELSATIAGAMSPTGPDTQKADILVIDGAVTLQVEVTRKPTKTVDFGGKQSVAQGYLLRFPTGVDIDIYVVEGGGLAAWDVPSQLIKAVAPGFEDLVVDPTTKMPELSQPNMKTRAEKAVKVRMRDGVDLAADMALPDGEGKFPAILVRTPYGRGASMVNADWWAKRGYVYICQDCRGRGDSAGDWEPMFHERKDGYDTIEWIAKQPWSSGSVGMIGGSYLGWVQWWAAVEAPPALKCIVPQVSPPDPFFNLPYDHGIPMLYGAVWWSNYVKDKDVPKTGPERLKSLDAFKTLPITRVEEAVLKADVPFVDRWWEKERWSDFEGANFMRDMKNVKIPALHISGWWDGDGIGTKMNWAEMRRLKRTNQWLIYGPWTHAFNTTSRLGEIDYGPTAILEMESVYLRWFDTWLKGKQVGLEKLPKVRVFVTGANEWRDLQDWPDPRSKERKLYLSAPGPANGMSSMGELADVPPAAQEPDRYTYNPANAQIDPALLEEDPTKASTAVKLDKAQDDILVYKTAPLTEPVELGGPIEADLWFSSSAPDTDFFASLVDIDTDGVMRAIGMTGKIRAKYVKSFDKPELLKPGRIYRAAIEPWDTAHRFDKGHRIGLLIDSQAFPMYARNLNTGEPIKDAVRMVAASQAIYHDAKHPSVLRFRVLPPKEK